MRIELSEDSFGFLLKLNGTSEEFGSMLQSFKDAIPAACRNYDGAKRTWRVALRAADALQVWLAEIGELGATFVDLNLQTQERVERAESNGDPVRMRLLARAAYKELFLRPDAPLLVAECAYTALRSQARDEQSRASLDGAIAVIRSQQMEHSGVA